MHVGVGVHALPAPAHVAAVVLTVSAHVPMVAVHVGVHTLLAVAHAASVMLDVSAHVPLRAVKRAAAWIMHCAALAAIVAGGPAASVYSVYAPRGIQV